MDKKNYSPAKNVALSSMMSVLLIVGKLSLSWLANVEIITALIISFVLMFGFVRTLTAVNVFCVLDMILYQFSIAVAICYFIHWNLLALSAFLVYILTKSKKIYLYIIVAFLHTLAFGFLTTFFECLFFGYNFWVRYMFGMLFFAVHLLSATAFTAIGVPLLLKTHEVIEKNNQAPK